MKSWFAHLESTMFKHPKETLQSACCAVGKPQSTNMKQGSYLRAAPCAWWASLPLDFPAQPPGSHGWWASLHGVCPGCAGMRVDDQGLRHPHRSTPPLGDSPSVRSSSSAPPAWTKGTDVGKDEDEQLSNMQHNHGTSLLSSHQEHDVKHDKTIPCKGSGGCGKKCL